ncbi:hypothetical protein GT347_06900 [Xylophilus rhododendri]|uniref:Uncharacterized protein n=1 Tax=Xylophilus rhododendri TaxID=2697032 RepID=A0A857J3W9_9BURK|nr:hypothetical protein [Xylophilus rhododendri]QHI97741.1 hypothetical protein GT347_06900 [Xylophilus rhododendri]
MKTENPESQPEHTDTVQTRALLREVSTLATNAIVLSRPRTATADNQEEDDREDRILLMRHALERVGWVADVALRQLGEQGMFERAEDWMLADR